MLGFMVITNDPLAVGSRFSGRKPELMYCSQNCSAVFIPYERRELPLEGMQMAVQGFIELFHHCRHGNNSFRTDFFCNEEGRLNSLPRLSCLIASRHMIHGDVLVCGADSEGDSIALSQKDLRDALIQTSLGSNQLHVEGISAWLGAGYSLSHHMQVALSAALTSLRAQLSDVYSRL
jgi:hypothetical protein